MNKDKTSLIRGLGLVCLSALLASCVSGGGESSSSSSSSSEAPSSSTPTSEGSSSSSQSPSSSSSSSSSQSSSSASSAGSSASSGGTSSNSDRGKTVNFTFWTTFGQTAATAVEGLADEFEALMLEHEGVTVNVTVSYQGGYDEMKTKIQQSFGAASTPTMAIAYPDHVAAYLDSSESYDYVYRLDDYMTSPEIGFGTQAYLGDTGADLEDIIPAYLEEGCQYLEEGYYSLPLMKSTEVVFYNVDAATRAMENFDGWDGKTSLEDFLNAMTFKEFLDFSQWCYDNKSIVGSNLNEGIWYDSDANFFITQMYQRGIPYASISEAGEGVIGFESGEARTKAEAMVAELNGYVKSGALKTKGMEGTYGSTDFTEGKCVFQVGSSGGAGYNNPTGGGFTVGVMRVPPYAHDDNALYVSQGPTMTFLRNQGISEEENDLRMKYAWQFAKFLTNTDNNAYLCTNGSEGYTPIRYSSQETANYTRYMASGEIYGLSAQVVLNDINGAYLNAPNFPGSAEMRDYCGGILTSVFNDESSDAAKITSEFDKAINETKAKM